MDEPNRWRTALEAALRVSEIASSSVALPEAVHAVARTAIEMLGAEQSSIMLLDESTQELVLVASAGQPTGVPLGHRLPVGEGIAGRVLATGQSLRLDQVDKDAFINFAPKDRDISSSVVAPLRANGRILGVLSLALQQVGVTFNEDDKRLAQMLADQAGSLIHRTKLHEQAERRSADLAALLESSKGLLGTVEVETILQNILDGGTRLAGGKHGFVCLFDSETGNLSGGVFRGFQKSVIATITQKPEVKRLIEEIDLGLVPPTEGKTYTALGIRSSQGTRGVMVIDTDPSVIEERGYLLRAFGQQCASALGTAELYSMVQRKESELGSIIQSVPNPIILADASGRIVSINPSAEQLFGLSSVFSSGTPVAGAFGNEEIENLLCGEGDLAGEVQIGTPTRTYKVRAKDVRVPGAPMGRVLVMDDVTTERNMVQTQHDFVAMIGHELRTPLTIVKGFARMLLKRIDTVTKADTLVALGTIDSKAAQLERLIEDLLYVSKIESREARLRIEPVDLTALVHRVAGEVLKDHPDREVKLDMAHEFPWPCDETKVALVVRHLVDNALKYSAAPEPVIVRISEDDEEVHIDVVDRGVGMVSSDIPDVFERFHQIDGSSTREHGGTGVGLYLCAQLIKVHEGRIWADSIWGKGSTFSFALPRRALKNDIVSLQGKQSQSG
jgi:PAS domain S-box-containing protein